MKTEEKRTTEMRCQSVVGIESVRRDPKQTLGPDLTVE